MKRFATTILAIGFACTAYAKPLHPEKYYQDDWCNMHAGHAEVVLEDSTRCDCLTSTHAIEFDFAHKFYEAIGQALYYGLKTGQRPGIVLIIETKSDQKYWLRLNETIQKFNLPIDTWEMKPK